MQVRDMRDDFERTLTSVSPLKEGLGESPLDRILPDDQRGRMFFEELARLQAEKVASDERKASRTCVLRPMGEVRAAFTEVLSDRAGIGRGHTSIFCSVSEDGPLLSGERCVLSSIGPLMRNTCFG